MPISENAMDQGRRGNPQPRKDPSACGHETLIRTEESGINDVDTDVSIYTCSSCGRTFTITDY